MPELKKISAFPGAKTIMRITFVTCVFIYSILMSGCNLENEEISSEYTSVTTASSEQTSSTAAATTTLDTVQMTSIAPDEVIPDAVQTPRVEGDRLHYGIVNVYADGEYYTVDVSGVKLQGGETADIDTTFIDGEMYGDFRLDLMQRGELLDTLKINVPRDDRFLILESVLQDRSYGCELISNKRDFETDEYPDLIQLDFYMVNEAETPQYARFFAVFDGKITEVPVYEDGEETAPYGTHLECREAGFMVQYITASTYGGEYTVLKFEYTFDVENRCLNRKQVKFYGYDQ